MKGVRWKCVGEGINQSRDRMEIFPRFLHTAADDVYKDRYIT